MTSIEEHKKKIREHLEEIDDAIDAGIEKKPITIGFHCSACAIQLLELYLHLQQKLHLSVIIKHDWFKRPKAGQKKEVLIERKLPVIFEKKEEIYDLIYTLEEERSSLMYGKSSKEQIQKVLDTFIKLKGIFKEAIHDDTLAL